MTEIALNRDQYLEMEKIALGAFAPLGGFMTEADFTSVVERLRLTTDEPFPLPVVLDVDRDTATRARGRPRVVLTYGGEQVGEMVPESIFSCDKDAVARTIFGTDDRYHPGYQRFVSGGEMFVGGRVELRKRAELDISAYELTPEETKSIFIERGWKTIVGFQTRNVPHRAHEYLQRVALEHVDGLFIQPLVGRKKAGDYTPEAIMGGYRRLIEDFYPPRKVLLGILSTAMRYAGPREAIFHAIIRRNYGCTHFVVGRDHAGVGDFYGKYEAHELVRRFDGELGIDVMLLHGPFHCSRCDGLVTEQTCAHYEGAPELVREISGTDIRQILKSGTSPDNSIIRPEVLEAVKDIDLFIEKDDA